MSLLVNRCRTLSADAVAERGSAATGITWRSIGRAGQPLLAFFIVDRDGYAVVSNPESPYSNPD